MIFLIVYKQHNQGGNMLNSEHYQYFENATKAREYLLSIKHLITREITHTQMHHTYIPNMTTCKALKGDPIKILQQCEDVRTWQMKNKEFFCGGQHMFTFPNGSVVICKQGVEDRVRIRDLNKKPAGIKGHNVGGICIENIGNYNWGEDTMTEAQRETIITLYATVHEMFDLLVNKDTCVYHAWHGSKSCPGTGFFGGNSVEKAEKNLYPLIEAKIKEFSAPEWKEKAIRWGLKVEMIEQYHNPLEQLDIGTYLEIERKKSLKYKKESEE